CASYDSPFAYW
nr:immunoglobulin heavy chain junction region [Mus musculus]MBK4189755.1 immunoglobulin heavy chain junction region [Mus musculus]